MSCSSFLVFVFVSPHPLVGSSRRCILRLILPRAEDSAFLICKNTTQSSQQAPLYSSRVGCGLAAFKSTSAFVPGTAPAAVPTVWLSDHCGGKMSQRLQAGVEEALETVRPISIPSILHVGSSVLWGSLIPACAFCIDGSGKRVAKPNVTPV